VARKKEVIGQLRQQLGQSEVEATQVLADMEGLKDDNLKLQRLIKESAKSAAQVRDLKAQVDLLRAAEKKLKEEVVQLTEKLRAARVEAQRKEQLAREFKDKLDLIQEELGQSQTRDREAELDRLRELNKKLKLEADIKENQVRSLKQRLEHHEQEIDGLKAAQLSVGNQTHAQSQLLESQLKSTKAKIKKYEGLLRRSLEALKKIGRELSDRSSHRRSSKQLKNANDNPMMISEFEKDFYKDSVSILGVSMDELEQFMNPDQSLVGKGGAVEAKAFISRLDKMIEIPESLN